MLILDTHIWLKWVIENGATLPTAINERIRNEKQIAISAISCLEVIWLTQKRKIELPLPPVEWINESISSMMIECIPISGKIAGMAGELPEHHKDPADRIIIATAIDQ